MGNTNRKSSNSSPTNSSPKESNSENSSPKESNPKNSNPKNSHPNDSDPKKDKPENPNPKNAKTEKKSSSDKESDDDEESRLHILAPSPAEARDFEEHGFTLGKQLGKGTFAVVKACSYKGSSDVLVAKIIITKRYDILFPQLFMVREMDVMSKIKHKNIVKVYKIFWYPDVIFMIMDNIRRGTLFEVVTKEGRLGENYGRRLFLQILDAMNYLHGLNIAHRDLKLENVMIDHEDNIFLIDFGFTIPVESKKVKNYLSHTFCGSQQYASPQILQHLPYNVFKSDVWSLGILIFIAVTEFIPYPDKNIVVQVRNQLSQTLDWPDDMELSDEFRDLIKCMLQPDENTRSSIKKLLKHKWVVMKDSIIEKL